MDISVLVSDKVPQITEMLSNENRMFEIDEVDGEFYMYSNNEEGEEELRSFVNTLRGLGVDVEVM